MRVYFEVARRSFQRSSSYRAATAAGAFTNTVFGFIKASIMVAVYRQQTDIGGWDRADALTFVFLTQAMIIGVGVFRGSGELGERVKTGEIVIDLYRPLDFQAYWLAVELGRSAFALFARGIPPLLVGAVTFGVQLPSAGGWSAFTASLVLAVLAAFGWTFMVGLVSFWVIDNRGPSHMSIAVLTFFAGFILPLNFFPDALRYLCRALPFVTMVQLPVEVFLGKHHGAGLIAVLAYQCLWAAVLLLAGRRLLARAVVRAEALGG